MQVAQPEPPSAPAEPSLSRDAADSLPPLGIDRQPGLAPRMPNPMANSVRGRLALLVAAITVPAILLVGMLTLQAYRNERESVSRHLIATARALSALVDLQLAECETLLRGLATSSLLAQDDMPGFHAQARALLQTAHVADDAHWITLSDVDGKLLVHTLRAPGEPLPQFSPRAELLSRLREGKTYISDVGTGRVVPGPVLFVSIPIIRNHELKYILSLAMRPRAFGEAINVGRIAPGSLVSVIDRNGTIAARTRQPERFVGEKMSGDFAASVANRSELVLESVTLDGVSVLTAFVRSPRSDWGVVVAAPRAEIFGGAQRLLWLGGIIAAALIGVAMLMVRWIGRALVRGVDSLVNDTEVLGSGAVPVTRSSGLAETDFVAAAMRRTAERLREKERDNARLTAALQTELEKQTRAEENSRRLAAIVQSSDDAIIGKDLSGIITSWNKGAERIFGYTAAEVVGCPITDLIPPERHAEERELFERVRRNESCAGLETLRRRKGGEIIQIALTVSPVVDREGRVLGVSTIARDITARKRTELQQQALHELVASVNQAVALDSVYAAALDAICRCQGAARAAILLTDADGVMRFKAARGLTESYRRAVEGHSPWAATETNPAAFGIDDITTASLDARLRQAIMDEGIRSLAFIPLAYEKRLLGKFMIYYDTPHSFQPQELRPVEAIASQVAFALIRQQTAEALEKLVDERTASLKQAVAQMQEFSYSVSHDLRAPVRAMYGFAEAVLENHGHRLDDEGREMLARILRNGARMDRLIQDLLTYSRVTRREMNFEPVSLDKLLDEVVQQYPAMQPDQADITINGPLPEVIAHEPSLTQVMSNLLSNAVKFVPPGARPRVRVGCETKQDRVRVWIEDNGIGIKPEYQSRLFGMFERVHPDKAYEGTGIGLAIVRKAVERMNGAVGVESDGISGSRFWVELPAARAAGQGG